MAKHRKDFELLINDKVHYFSCETWNDFYCECCKNDIPPICDYDSFETFYLALQKTSTVKIYELDKEVSISLKNCY